MATKKSGPNKSEFIRGQPADMPTAEVVAKAKEAGLTITSALVYKVRGTQKTKTKAAKGSKAAKGPKAQKNDSGVKKSAPVSPTAAPAETAEKPSAPAGEKPSASDFIRSLPATMSVSAVVKEGAAKGYSFSPSLVYMVRKPKKGVQRAGKIGRPKGSKNKKAAPSNASTSVHAPVTALTTPPTAGDKFSASASPIFNVETAVQRILSDSISAMASQISEAIRQGLAAAILSSTAPAPAAAASATPSPAPSSAKVAKTARRRGKRQRITQAELDAVLTVISKEPGLTSVQLQKAAGIDGKQAARVLLKLRETKKVHLKGSRSKATYTVA